MIYRFMAKIVLFKRIAQNVTEKKIEGFNFKLSHKANLEEVCLIGFIKTIFWITTLYFDLSFLQNHRF